MQTLEEIKQYLDGAIIKWREIKQKAVEDQKQGMRNAPHLTISMAEHYIDAFQSVRVSIFGELLP